MSRSLAVIAGSLLALPLLVQPGATVRPPVIDVHWHASLSPGDLRTPQAVAGRRRTMAALDSLNVRFLFVNGVPDAIAVWREEFPDRVIPGLMFPCENGIAPNNGRRCFADGAVFPDTGWLRTELTAGRIRFLGEVTAEYLGIAPNDRRLDPFYALAQGFDVPMAIHLGLGPPGAAYPSSPLPRLRGQTFSRLSRGAISCATTRRDAMDSTRRRRVPERHSSGWQEIT